MAAARRRPCGGSSAQPTLRDPSDRARRPAGDRHWRRPPDAPGYVGLFRVSGRRTLDRDEKRAAQDCRTCDVGQLIPDTATQCDD
jgi:hypothetical protein